MTKQNQRHDNANVDVRPNGIKFKPSLTKRRIDLLEYTDNVVKDVRAVKFAYPDMHGHLKMMFNEPVNRKVMHAFNSKVELAEINCQNLS